MGDPQGSNTPLEATLEDTQTTHRLAFLATLIAAPLKFACSLFIFTNLREMSI